MKVIYNYLESPSYNLPRKITLGKVVEAVEFYAVLEVIVPFRIPLICWTPKHKVMSVKQC